MNVLMQDLTPFLLCCEKKGGELTLPPLYYRPDNKLHRVYYFTYLYDNTWLLMLPLVPLTI